MQRSINEMEFILVADVSNASLGTKVGLERCLELHPEMEGTRQQNPY